MIVGTTQRWRERRGAYRPVGEVFDRRAFEVAPLADDATAKAFVVTHHYSGSYPAARRRFGLYRHDALVGVVVFSQPVTNAALRPFPADAAMELGRLVLLDDVPGNAESWLVARCLDALRREGLAGVVSFSDPERRVTSDGNVVMPGHVGGVYQALGARYLGRATARTLRLFTDGTVLNDRTLQKIRARERGWRHAAAQLVGHGATPPSDDLRVWLARELPRITRTVRHPGNLRYLLPLTAGAARDVGEGLPYPKLCDVGLCGDGRARFHREGCDRRAA